LIDGIRPTHCDFGEPDMTKLFVISIQSHFFRLDSDRAGWRCIPDQVADCEIDSLK